MTPAPTPGSGPAPGSFPGNKPSPPHVSVVMPVFNALPHLWDAVASVLGQTLGDLELIAVDDGSTDGSSEVLSELAGGDARLRVVTQPNRGVTAALIRGMSEARAGLVARMDADDVCEPGRLAAQAAVLDAEPGVAAVGCAVTLIDPEGAVIHVSPYPTDHEGILARLLTGKSAMGHPAAMLRAEMVRQVGGYDPAYATAQDFDLFLRLSEVGALANLPDALLRYRVHARSVGAQRRADQHAAVARALEEHARRTGHTIPPPPTRPVPSPIDQQAKWARWARRAGHRATARKHARAVLRRRPWRITLWPMAVGRQKDSGS